MLNLLQLIAEIAVALILQALWWLLMFPVVWIVSLPFILLLALFNRKPYRRAVVDMFISVHEFWSDWGPWRC